MVFWTAVWMWSSTCSRSLWSVPGWHESCQINVIFIFIIIIIKSSSGIKSSRCTWECSVLGPQEFTCNSPCWKHPKNVADLWIKSNCNQISVLFFIFPPTLPDFLFYNWDVFSFWLTQEFIGSAIHSCHFFFFYHFLMLPKDFQHQVSDCSLSGFSRMWLAIVLLK